MTEKVISFMWENIVASSLVCGTLLVIFGLFNYIIKRKQLNNSLQHFKKIDAQTIIGARVILLNGIVGQIKSINKDFIDVEISPGVIICCMRYSIKQIITNN